MAEALVITGGLDLTELTTAGGDEMRAVEDCLDTAAEETATPAAVGKNY